MAAEWPPGRATWRWRGFSGLAVCRTATASCFIASSRPSTASYTRAPSLRRRDSDIGRPRLQRVLRSRQRRHTPPSGFCFSAFSWPWTQFTFSILFFLSVRRFVRGLCVRGCYQVRGVRWTVSIRNKNCFEQHSCTTNGHGVRDWLIERERERERERARERLRASAERSPRATARPWHEVGGRGRRLGR